LFHILITVSKIYDMDASGLELKLKGEPDMSEHTCNPRYAGGRS
jgi:hypothetical protein